jgi:hypothetical protein
VILLITLPFSGVTTRRLCAEDINVFSPFLFGCAKILPTIYQRRVANKIQQAGNRRMAKERLNTTRQIKG